MQIDINSDLGEAFGDYPMGRDDEMLQLVSSANIACGFHAGDPVVMTKTVETALANGIDIGAHPGFDDIRHFGRRKLPVDIKELEAETLYQIGALDGIARARKARVSHVTFHGALGNMLYKDAELADALMAVVKAFDPGIIVPVTPGTEIERASQKLGLRTLSKFFVDRAYTADGRLAPRGRPGAVIEDSDEAARRVVRLLDSGTVATIEGEILHIEARMVIVHGDTPHAVEMARTVRRLVEKNGGEIVPLSRLAPA